MRQARLPDRQHLVAQAGEDCARAGFGVQQDCSNPHGSIESKRIVVQRKGLGLSRTCGRL
jgi:hypothetical protein